MCRARSAPRRGRVRVTVEVRVRVAIHRLLREPVKLRDEHRRKILQTIFRLHAREVAAVVHELVCDLVNDERRARVRRERVERVLQKLTLFCGLKDAERDPGDNIVAVRDAAQRKLGRELGCIAVQDRDAPIAAELLAEMPRELRVELEEQQPRIRVHPPRELTGVAAFARPEFRDHPRGAQVHFRGDLANERLRTRHDRGDLKWMFDKSLQEYGAHGTRKRGASSSGCGEDVQRDDTEFFFYINGTDSFDKKWRVRAFSLLFIPKQMVNTVFLE